MYHHSKYSAGYVLKISESNTVPSVVISTDVAVLTSIGYVSNVAVPPKSELSIPVAVAPWKKFPDPSVDGASV